MKFINFTQIICLSLFSMIFSACASLNVEIPMPMAESSEARGGDSGRMHLDTEPSVQYSVSSDVSARPPNLDSPTVSSSLIASGRYEHPLFDKLDLGIGLYMGQSFLKDLGYQLYSKFQLLGDSEATAKKGNVSLGLFYKYAHITGSNSGNQNGNLGGGGFPWSASATSKAQIYGVSLGYRLSDRVLLYLGGGKSYYNIDGKITQDEETGSASPDPGGTYTFETEGESLGYTLGFNFYFSGGSFIKVAYVLFESDTVKDKTLNTKLTENSDFLSVGFNLKF